MADGGEDTTGVTGPQTPKNPEKAGEIEENVEEQGGGPVGVTVPQKPDDEGKPSQE